MIDLLIYLLGPALIALIGRALRLWFKAVREQRQQETLRTLSSNLPTTGEIEIRDTRNDGSQLHIRINTTPGTARP
ncbi:hypothetical protein [Amycolatopsis sp. NPDC051102]|uniref:hypothetical protein n=1 Tax=Amycolatopsis sp. NPDC051102 TaxID=3155163 RepID=UPI003426B73F